VGNEEKIEKTRISQQKERFAKIVEQ